MLNEIFSQYVSFSVKMPSKISICIYVKKKATFESKTTVHSFLINLLACV